MRPRCAERSLFATGLATTAAKLRLGAGSRFTGLKLWRWWWHALGGPPCRKFTHNWIGIDPASLLAALGLSHRRLQRLFERDFGLPLRSYLRLLRFRSALAGVQGQPSLAHAAAA